jgi:hypothetical protein
MTRETLIRRVAEAEYALARAVDRRIMLAPDAPPEILDAEQDAWQARQAARAALEAHDERKDTP